MTWLIFTALVTYLVLRLGLPIMHKRGWLTKNYRGKDVVTPSGILLPIPTNFFLLILLYFKALTIDKFYLIFVFQGIVYGVGLLDDLYGTTKGKGFAGHLSLLRDGKISTGILKIMGCTLGAFFFIIGMGLDTFSLVVVYLLLALLGINSFNLLDKRPGRCLKGIIFMGLFVLTKDNYLLIMLIGISLGVLPFDLREEAMLGDTGANYLGCIFVISLILTDNLPLDLLFLILFVILNIINEISSLSLLIDRNYFLHKIDLWGR